MAKTAAELIAELESNKRYLARKNEQDKKIANLEKICADDEKELVKELNQAGYSVGSVWDLVNSKNDYLKVVPILISHLKVKHHPKILAGLARSLAVDELSNNEELWSVLIDIYEKTPSDSEIDSPEDRGAQQAIAVALECLVNSSRVESLKALIDRNPQADGVGWLQDKIKDIRKEAH